MENSEKAVKLLAIINQLEDEGQGPQVVIINQADVIFPPHLMKQQSVLFNIGSTSVGFLNLDKDGISFSARFNGAEHTIYAPLSAIAQVQSKDGKTCVKASQLEPKVSFKSSYWDFTPRAYHSPFINEVSLAPTVPPPAPTPIVKAKPNFRVYVGGGLGDGISTGKLMACS